MDSGITRSGREKRRTALLEKVKAGDTLVCFNLAIFGGTLGSIVYLLNLLLEKNISISLIESGAHLSHADQGTILSLLAETESSLLAERTTRSKEKIKKTKPQLGRPTGKKGKSKLDPHLKEIKSLLKKGTSVRSIARQFSCSDTAVHNFMKNNKLT